MKRLWTLIAVLFLSAVVYCADIPIRDSKGVAVGKLRLSSGTTYNIYNTKGTKIGTYKALQKLTSTYLKGKKFKLIKIGNLYTIKEWWMFFTYIEFLIKYGSYGLITILCIVIFLLTRWIVNNHLASISKAIVETKNSLTLKIEDVDRTVKALHKRLDEEEVMRDRKDEEQGKELVGIAKDIEYISKDVKRIDDKVGRYLNGGKNG